MTCDRCGARVKEFKLLARGAEFQLFQNVKTRCFHYRRVAESEGATVEELEAMVDDARELGWIPETAGTSARESSVF